MLTAKMISDKILFLDIDGVLNHADFLYAKHPVSVECKSYKFRREAFDPAAIARLNKIIEATDAKIVISSSWRRLFDISELRDIFNSRGIKGTIIDCTSYNQGNRGEEITAWLNHFFGSNTVKNTTDYNLINFNYHVKIAIIDDSIQDLKRWEFYQVITKWKEGLLDHHVDRAIALLTHGAISQEKWAY